MWMMWLHWYEKAQMKLLSMHTCHTKGKKKRRVWYQKKGDWTNVAVVNYTEDGKEHWIWYDGTKSRWCNGTVMGMIRKMKYVSSYVVDKMEDVHKRLEGRWQRKLFVLYSHTQKPGFNKQSWNIIPAGEKWCLKVIMDVQLKEKTIGSKSPA